MRKPSSLCFVSLFALTACPAAVDSSLGDLPGSSGAAQNSSGETEPSAGSSTGEAAMDEGDLGLPCGLQSTPETFVLEGDNASCRTGLCTYPDPAFAPVDQACDDDAQCGGPAGKVWCDPQTGTCELDPRHIEEYTMCSETCEVDTDCVGAAGSACESGFICAPLQSLGPQCCQKVCLCADVVDLAVVGELQDSCELSQASGCCDQVEVPEACG